jgi:nucleolar protein 9
LECEAEDDESLKPLSILDILTEGLVAHSADPDHEITPQPFPTLLLTSSTGTRLFETILRTAPEEIFKQIWKLYFEGRIGKLAVHPMANFVVARGVSRLRIEEIERVIRECGSVSGGRGLISKLPIKSARGSLRLCSEWRLTAETARTSVLQALVDRAGDIKQCELDILQVS